MINRLSWFCDLAYTDYLLGWFLVVNCDEQPLICHYEFFLHGKIVAMPSPPQSYRPLPSAYQYPVDPDRSMAPSCHAKPKFTVECCHVVD
jgi:hypothetical protein